MPAAPLICLRRCCRPIALLTIGLLLWQALATSMVAAEAASLAASGFDAGIICHSAGNAGGANPADHDSRQQDCCAWCMATSAPVLPDLVPAAARPGWIPAGKVLPVRHLDLAISPRAVRAGFSQPPPTEA